MGLTTMIVARDRLVAAADEGLTGEQVCAEIAGALQRVAPYDAAAVMTTDPDTHLPAGGVVSGFDASECAPFWDNELLDPDFNKFNDLARSPDPVATLVEATDGDLTRSPRHQKLYAAYGASDELRAVFMAGDRCLAIGAFVRTGGAVFDAQELCDVRALLAPATALLRRALGRCAPTASMPAPTVLILDAADRVISMTSDGAAMLSELMTGQLGVSRALEGTDPHALPGTIQVAVSHTRASRTSTRFTTRLRSRSGVWVQVQVAALDGPGEQVAVSIDAIRSAELIPLLLESYGLTAREIEIVLCLCRGLPTRDIAAELAISTHTVRDHLKAVFEKTHVTTRGELVAGLFTSQLLTGLHDATDRIEHPSQEGGP